MVFRTGHDKKPARWPRPGASPVDIPHDLITPLADLSEGSCAKPVLRRQGRYPDRQVDDLQPVSVMVMALARELRTAAGRLTPVERAGLRKLDPAARVCPPDLA